MFMPEGPFPQPPLAIIGEEDIVMGFKALGFTVFAVKDGSQVSADLEEIISRDVAVCLVQEEFYQAAAPQLLSLRHLALPIFIPFAKDGGMTLVEKLIREIRLKAIGVL